MHIYGRKHGPSFVGHSSKHKDGQVLSVLVHRLFRQSMTKKVFTDSGVHLWVSLLVFKTFLYLFVSSYITSILPPVQPNHVTECHIFYNVLINPHPTPTSVRPTNHPECAWKVKETLRSSVPSYGFREHAVSRTRCLLKHSSSCCTLLHSRNKT